MKLGRLVPTAVAVLVLGAAGSTSALVASHDPHHPAGGHRAGGQPQVDGLLQGAYAASYDRLSAGSHTVRVATPPRVVGVARVGETLSATPGTWRPRDVKVRYQWLVGGRSVPGATRPTYVPGARALGQKVSVVVVARASGWTAGTAVSAPTRKVRAGALELRGTPVLTGRAAVGRRLSVTAGSWSPRAVEVSYQWYRGRTSITRATRPDYRVTRADRGARLRVVVSASKPGYDDASASLRSAPVS